MEQKLYDFWIYIQSEYVELSHLAIDVLIYFFCTTYLCEEITAIKSKYCNHVHLESGLWGSVSVTRWGSRLWYKYFRFL
jgi:hypothetical protein